MSLMKERLTLSYLFFIVFIVVTGGGTFWMSHPAAETGSRVNVDVAKTVWKVNKLVQFFVIRFFLLAAEEFNDFLLDFLIVCMVIFVRFVLYFDVGKEGFQS